MKVKDKFLRLGFKHEDTLGRLNPKTSKDKGIGRDLGFQELFISFSIEGWLILDIF